MKNYFYAIAIFIGYIIGAGIFVMPSITVKSGILSFFIFLIGIGFVQYFLHLIYAEIILSTKKFHRLPGYTEKYLGKKWKFISLLGKIIVFYGALLAYIVIFGIFASQLFSISLGGNEFIYANIFFIIGAGITFFGITTLGWMELLLTFLLLTIIALIGLRGVYFINLINYNIINLKYFLLPYGALLFATNGSGAVPIVVKLLTNQKNKIKQVIKIGIIASISIVAIFTLIVVGISGSQTTPDALTGLKLFLKDGAIKLSLIFALLTITTSFLGIAQAMKETYLYDFNFNKNLSWLLTVSVPYIMYLFGFKNLISIISFSGSVAGGLLGIILIMILIQVKKKAEQKSIINNKINPLIAISLSSLFILGIIYEVWFFIK